MRCVRHTVSWDYSDTNDAIEDQERDQKCNQLTTFSMRSPPVALACPVQASHPLSDSQLR